MCKLDIPQGTIKINVDAGISTDHDVGWAFAVIAMEWKLSGLVYSCDPQNRLLDPATVEAVACR